MATCKVSQIPENLYRAAGAFLEKSDVQIQEFIRNILKGHLRSIVGKLDINSLLRERDNFNKRVVEESAPELVHLAERAPGDTLRYSVDRSFVPVHLTAPILPPDAGIESLPKC